MKISREEFVIGFNEAFDDIDNPASDVNVQIVEGTELAECFADHDPILATMMEEVVRTLQNAQDYIRIKGKVT